MNNLAARFATAAVLVPVLLWALFWDPSIWGVLGLATLAAVLALDEYLRMALRVTATDRCWGLRIVTGASGLTLLLAATLAARTDRVALVLTVAMIAIAVVVLMRREQLSRAGQQLGVAVAGLVYVPLLLATVPAYKRDFGDAGAPWLLVVLGIAFLSDTFAYFAGKTFGKHRLYPEVSPNKTWEGAVGGWFGGLVATFGFGVLWLIPELDWRHAVVLGIVGSAVGQLGDLVESAIKRTFGVKDAGRLLPGHGGMLDRIDGLMFVAPVVYYYVRTFVTPV